MLYRLARAVLFSLEAERAHELACGAARLGQAAPGLLRACFAYRDPILVSERFGLTFPNPVGLAAGFDKNARLVRAMGGLGCGFVEVGSVTGRPSQGNPRPRAFRLPEDEALINRLGLGNEGANAIGQRLGRLRAGRPLAGPLLVNLAKTHDPEIAGELALDDYAHSVRETAAHADALVLNVSCPNTREGKTFEDPASLDALLARVRAELAALELSPPLLVKISPPAGAEPDPARIDELVGVIAGHDIAGLVAANTASDRSGLATDPARLEAIGNGGLSGRPLAARSLALVRALYRKLDGALPIVGVGGIDSAESAYQRIRAGASLIELYTALVYHGPGLVGRINRGLARLLRRDGLDSLDAAVGADA